MKTCFYLTKEAMQGAKVIYRNTYPLKIEFIASDKRKRDLDNLLASAKCSLDAVAQAMGIDDRQFEPVTISRGYEKGKSCMKLKIGE